MTGPSSIDPVWPTPSWRERVARWRLDWEQRFLRFASPEVLAGTVIVVLSALAATVTTGSPLAMGLAVVCGTVVHLAAVDSGNHSVGWLATGIVLAFGVTAGGRLFDGLSPIAYTVPSLIALIHSELLATGHARRRSGQVDRAVAVSSASGLLGVGLLSVAAVALAQRLATGAERSWLWMAGAVALVAVAALALTWVPARRPNKVRRRRWRPGDRLPPVPFDELEVDDTVGA